MLHVEPVFRQFTDTEATDTATSREVIVGLSAGSRQRVDDLLDRVVAAGGQAPPTPGDRGPLYVRGFRDLDGHQRPLLHLDVPSGPR